MIFCSGWRCYLSGPCPAARTKDKSRTRAMQRKASEALSMDKSADIKTSAFHQGLIKFFFTILGCNQLKAHHNKVE